METTQSLTSRTARPASIGGNDESHRPFRSCKLGALARHRRRGKSEVRPPGPAHGMRGAGRPCLRRASLPLAAGPSLDQQGPVRPVRRPRMHAALLPASPFGVRPQPGRHPGLPPARVPHAGAPGMGHDPGRGGNGRPAGAGPGQRRGDGHRGADSRREVQYLQPHGHRPLDVRACKRRRHDGRGRLGGRLPCRAPEARQAHRVL